MSRDSETEQVSRRVVEKVAAARDVDPCDLDPLFQSVDPDALNALFRDVGSGTSRDVGFVEFPMADCRVVVRADGTVWVDPGAESPSGIASDGQQGSSSQAVESPD